MMLYEQRTEPNKILLRALMTNYFASSPEAHRRLAHVEAFSASAEGCKASHFQKLWSKAAQVGPLPQTILNELSRHASAAAAKSYDSYFMRAWEKVAHAGPQPDHVIAGIAARAKAEHGRDLSNAKGLFFAHLVEFVRSIKIPTAKFAPLPDTPEAAKLRDAVKSQLGQLVRALQDNTAVQNLILTEFTPAQLEKASMPPVPPPLVMEPAQIVPLMHEGMDVGIPFTPPPQDQASPQGLRLH